MVRCPCTFVCDNGGIAVFLAHPYIQKSGGLRHEEPTFDRLPRLVDISWVMT